MPYNPDFSGARQDGAGPYQTTTRNARRCSTAVGYLRPALSRNNLTLRTGAQINRVVVEKGRAVGVELMEGGRPHAAARRARSHTRCRRDRLAQADAPFRHGAGR